MRAVSKLGGRPKPQAKNAQALLSLTKKASNTLAPYAGRNERPALLPALLPRPTPLVSHSGKFRFLKCCEGPFR